MGTHRLDTVVIGGGQAGLATGYHLAHRGTAFVILDAGRRVGAAWRDRWDSLRLFTPARFDHLPGMPFPAPDGYFPTKDEMADYLEAYAARFQLPMELGVRVEELGRDGNGYLITAGHRSLEAARSWWPPAPPPPRACRPSPSSWIRPSSSSTRSTTATPVSCATVPSWSSGRATPAPRSRWNWRARTAFGWPAGTPAASPSPWAAPLPGDEPAAHRRHQARPQVRRPRRRPGHPLVRVRPQDLTDAAVQRTPRVTGVRGGRPVLDDGRVLEVDNVVWCTGFARDYRWVRLPVFGPGGDPVHHRGVVDAEPGLYFVGLPLQYSLASSLVGGVGADAQHLVEQIAARQVAAVPARA
jgi:putative flavoprotein involved in K+ transport